MKRTHGFFLFSSLTVLFALAGCGRSFLQGERAAWRGQAEAQCMQSGAVKLGSGVVQIKPIEGPGMCGADFPLKVAALGESPRLSYSDVPRPPGTVANGSQPNWARFDQPYAPAPQGGQLRWTPGPPSIAAPESAPSNGAPAARPMSISPPGVAEPEPDAVEPDDVPDDVELPQQRNAPPRTQPAYNAPPQQERQLPALGPARAPMTTGAVGPATLTPAATLSCPIVSALDRWVSEGVQPAAMRWFGAPVTEIKQISAYSCRGMVGAGTSHISEHAFGNALDVAGFTLADGRKITVQNGWHGTPEEQGFLHDVQSYACDVFTTVLSPGYNPEHYNHIHVDLMRRANGRRPCRPNPIPGEVAAAKARSMYASKHGTPYTGSIGKVASTDKAVRVAVPGADGYDEDDDAVIASMAASPMNKMDDEPAPKKQSGWPRFAPFKPVASRQDNPANH